MFAAFCCWQCDRMDCQPSTRAAGKADLARAEVQLTGIAAAQNEKLPRSAAVPAILVTLGMCRVFCQVFLVCLAFSFAAFFFF